MRYSKPISNLPGNCDGCGGEFSIQHALECKKGGLITLRHNEIRDTVGDLASLYWKDIRREPIIRGGVWNPQESVAFDVTVTDTDAESYSGRSTESILRSAEQEKKQKYQDDCQERHTSFTTLVISVDGVLGAEFNQFLKRLGEGLSLKWERKYSQVMSWIRARISFATLRVTSVCLRATRTKWRCLEIEDGASFARKN